MIKTKKSILINIDEKYPAICVPLNSFTGIFPSFIFIAVLYASYIPKIQINNPGIISKNPTIVPRSINKPFPSSPL